MQKRASRKIEAATVATESAFQEGVLVQYYDYGYRYGHISSVDVDDDGDLYCKVQPIVSKHTLVKPRALGYKSTDLKVMAPKENNIVPTALAPASDVQPGQQPIHDGRDHADGDHFLRDLYQRITSKTDSLDPAASDGHNHDSR